MAQFMQDDSSSELLEKTKLPWEYTLQELTFDVIIKNFEFFVQEYSSSRSRFPKHYFKFLQKKYSNDILHHLLIEGKFKTVFLDFVLNQNLSEIDFSSILEDCNSFVLSRKLLPVSKNLVKFSAMGSRNFHCIQRSLFYMINLQELKLEYAGISDTDLQIIVDSCPLLRLLNVYGSFVTDDGIKYLCCPRKHKLQLESLNVERTFVKPNGILMILKTMDKIEHLFYEKLSYVIKCAGQNDIFTKKNCLNLKDITIIDVNNELKLCSELCPYVKNLQIRAINNSDQLIYCLNFKEVKNVSMSFNHSWPSIYIDPFVENCGTRIHTLKLKHFTVSVAVLCKACPVLQFLELDQPIFAKVPVEHDPSLKFNNLLEFKIFGTLLSLDDQKMAVNFILMFSPKLISLAIQDCIADNDVLESIFRSPIAFTHLNFSGTIVNVLFLHNVLHKYNNLSKLVINNTFDLRKLHEVAASVNSRVEIIEYLYQGLRRM